MTTFSLPRLLAPFIYAALVLLGATAARAQNLPLLGVDVGVEQTPGQNLIAGRTDGTGLATLKIPKAGTYRLLVQPLTASRSGNYSRGRINTTKVAISGGLKPTAGSYNLTGTSPCLFEISVGNNTTIHIRITPPPQPLKNDAIRPAMT